MTSQSASALSDDVVFQNVRRASGRVDLKIKSKPVYFLTSHSGRPGDVVSLGAAALMLGRYGMGEDGVVLSLAGDGRGDPFVAINPGLAPGQTITQLLELIAGQAVNSMGIGDAKAAGQYTSPSLAPDLRRDIDVFEPGCHRCLVIWLGDGLDDGGPDGRLENARRAIAEGLATIVFMLAEGVNGLSLRLDYRPNILGRRLAKRMAVHLVRTLVQMGHGLDQSVEHCQIISTSEQRLLLNWARGPVRKYPFEHGLKALFESRVRGNPQAIAIVDEDLDGQVEAMACRSITYGELDCLANDIGRDMRDAGVAPGDVVAIRMRRSIDYLGALLAAIKVRAVVLPIDDSYPDDYVRHMLQETAAVAICLSSKDARAIASLPVPRAILIDWQSSRPAFFRPGSAVHDDAMAGHQDGGTARDSGSLANEADEANSRFLIMYTSGSTGKPKAVVHCQRQVLNRLHWMWETYPIMAGELFCQRSPVSVMPSIWEFLGGLLSGAPTVIAPASVARDPALLADFLARHRPTRFTILPSLLSRLLERDTAGRDLASLRVVTIGGEMFSPELYGAFRKLLPACLFVEDYGCTEVNTIWHYALEPRERKISALPGGRPIANLAVYIVDRFGQLAPRGTIGELAVAGASLAVEYLGAPKEYVQRFTANRIDPSSGPQLYHTGDLGFLGTAGSIRLAGRADHQLKVRGMRIEPSELETVMLQHQAVAECCAVVRKDDREGGELVLFLVPRDGACISASECRAFLADRLPAFMTPTQVVMKDRLPTTLSGKRDRKNLMVAANTASEAANGPLEPQMIRSLLAEVLGQDLAEIKDDVKFQMLGLDSMRALTFAERLRGLGLPVTSATLFDHYTLSALLLYLRNQKPLPGTSTGTEIQRADGLLGRRLAIGRESDIAVVGMAGRFPGSDTVDELWLNLAAGRDSVAEIPPERWRVADHYDPDPSLPNKSVSKWGALLQGIDEFDPLMLRISPAEAALMDPQLRISLQEAWRAFEDAGYSPAVLEDMAVGIFAGLRKGDFETLLDRTELAPDRATILGNDPSMFAARLALRMNLTGPSLTVDSACSSSLSAVHLACRSLIDGECTLAIAGGACIILSVDHYIATSKLGIFSPTGHCKAFDADADGFVQGEGAAFVILKRLEQARRDGDNIHAVIKGSALNHDGRTNGLGVPSARAQTAVQRDVYERHEISPDTITLVEAHGTGTRIGDQIEIEALARSIGGQREKRSPCAVGSIKTNIGHLTAAAGVAGLIKAILCLKHRQIPPSLNFHTPSPLIPFSDTPFYVSDRLHDWSPPAGIPRRAAINSFGLSGTNVHCVVEEAPQPPVRNAEDVPAHLIVLSAQTPAALARQASALQQFIAAGKPKVELGDLAYTLLVGRERLACLQTVVAADWRELELGLLAGSSSGLHGRINASDPAVGEESLIAESKHIISELRTRPPVRRYRECLSQLAALIQHGLRPDGIDFYPPGTVRRVSLPTYRFERQICWPAHDVLKQSQTAASPVSNRHDREVDPLEAASRSGSQDPRELLDQIRQEAGNLLGIPVASIDAAMNLDVYGFDSMAAVDLRTRLEARLGCKIPIAYLVDMPSVQQLSDRLTSGAQAEAGGLPTSLAEPGQEAAKTRMKLQEFALTPVQAGYVFGQIADGVAGHVYLEFQIDSLDIPRLTHAWNLLVERHPMLRAEIKPSGRQRVRQRVPVYEFTVHRPGDKLKLDLHLEEVRARFAACLYGLGHWPLFSIEVTIPSSGPAIVHVNMDTSIADWTSADIIYQEWYRLYQLPELELPPLEATFQGYCSQLDALRASPEGVRQSEYWRRKLANCPAGPDLGKLTARTGPPQFRRRTATIGADRWSLLKQRAAALGVFPTSLVLACFAQTLASQKKDLPFAIVQTHADRRLLGAPGRSVVGPFTRTSVVIAEHIAGRSIEDIASRMNIQMIEDLESRDICAAGVLGDIARETGHRPKLTVVFTPRLGIGRSAGPLSPSWLDRLTFTAAQTPGITLECRVSEVAGELLICWDVAEDSLPINRTVALLADFELRLRLAAAEQPSTISVIAGPVPFTALQRVYLAEAFRIDQGPWAEGAVYQEFDVENFDLRRFRQALRTLTDCEPTLTAGIAEQGWLPRNGKETVALLVNDLTLAGNSAMQLADIRTRMLGQQAAAKAHIRAQVSLQGKGWARIHLAVDMIAADGFSTMLLYVKLFAAYQNANVGAPVDQSLPRPMADHSPSGAVYWQQRLQDIPPGPTLPRPKPHAVRPFDMKVPVARLTAADLDIWKTLRERAARHSLSIDSVLVAALNGVLTEWNETDDRFKTILALTSRHVVAPDAAAAIGDFTALSWVGGPSPECSLAQHAAELNELIATDLEHRRSFPMEAMSKLGQGAGTGDRSHQCVVYTGAIAEPAHAWPEAVKFGFGAALTPGVDLDCFVHNLGGRLTVHWDYRPEAISDAAIASMFDAYVKLLDQLSGDDRAWSDVRPSVRRRWMAEAGKFGQAGGRL
ncbi:AMP-binding protein [Sinorhizobium medicae]|nr:AMP-binding protein [Sinorhizobium medicae]